MRLQKSLLIMASHLGCATDDGTQGDDVRELKQRPDA